MCVRACVYFVRVGAGLCCCGWMCAELGWAAGAVSQLAPVVRRWGHACPLSQSIARVLSFHFTPAPSKQSRPHPPAPPPPTPNPPSRTLLKFGIAVGCRTMILLKSLLLGKSSLYYKRYSKVEFFIIAWTAYIIEIPVPHEAAVSGGTAVIIAAMAALFPHHFLPEVNPINVALQVRAGGRACGRAGGGGGLEPGEQTRTLTSIRGRRHHWVSWKRSVFCSMNHNGDRMCGHVFIAMEAAQRRAIQTSPSSSCFCLG